MNCLVLMSGSSNAFYDAGFLYPKNLTRFEGKPMVQHVLESLMPLKEHGARFICAVRRDENRKHYTGRVLHLIDEDCIVYETSEETSGAACTALLAVDHINTDEPLIITNGDQILDNVDLAGAVSFFQENSWDAGVIVFEDFHPRWSFVKCDSTGSVIEAAEKRPISKYATAGFYYFARGKDFVSAAMEMIKKDAHVNNLFYICPVFNELILQQKKIRIFEMDPKSYISLSLPSDVKAYSNR